MQQQQNNQGSRQQQMVQQPGLLQGGQPGNLMQPQQQQQQQQQQQAYAQQQQFSGGQGPSPPIIQSSFDQFQGGMPQYYPQQQQQQQQNPEHVLQPHVQMMGQGGPSAAAALHQQQHQMRQDEVAEPTLQSAAQYSMQYPNQYGQPASLDYRSHQFGPSQPFGMPQGATGHPPMIDPAFQDPEMKKHLDELNLKFETIKDEIDRTSKDLNDFKQQQLPLARIKKIMKSDEDVRMISSEAPILFALACRLFITEITHKAAFHARKQQRKTLQRNDIAKVISENETFDFLLDVIPREEIPSNVNLSHNQRALLQDVDRMNNQRMQYLANGQKPNEQQQVGASAQDPQLEEEAKQNEKIKKEKQQQKQQQPGE